MAQKYTRRLSFNERSYLVNDVICPPFYNQFIFEGSGTLNLENWTKAVAKASEANPGSRLILKGFLQFCKWVDSGNSPRVREVDGSSWDGFTQENIPFLDEALDPYRGPTCEVVLVRGNPQKVVYRSLHAVMDGRGMLHWAEDICRCLRGEDPVGSDSPLTDDELAWRFQKEGRTPPPAEFIPPTGKASGTERGFTYRRIIIEGKIRKLLPQIALLTAREAWRHSPGGKVRFMIPVDLRFRDPAIRSTGNLTNSIYITVTPETTVEDIANDINAQIANNDDCKIYHREKIMNYIPLRFMYRAGKRLIAQKHAAGLYHNSGVISNMGRFNMQNLSGDGFTAETVWGIPPRQEIVPIFIGLGGHLDAIAMIVAMPLVLASNGRIEEFIDHVTRGLIRE